MLPGYHRDRIISLLRGVILLVLVLPSSNAKAQVNFRAVRGYLVVVPAYVNGLGPFDFLVDTGTNTTLIDPGLAQQMGGKPVGSQLLRTLTGSETVLRYSLGS